MRRSELGLLGTQCARQALNTFHNTSGRSVAQPRIFDREYLPQHCVLFAQGYLTPRIGQSGVQWHLGSLYNDSELFGGISSSPVTHGFDDFNSTLMVAPTATTNCKCNPDWYSTCLFGHYADGRNKAEDSKVKTSMCWHGKNGSGQALDPGCSRPPSGCCYNYWWRNDSNAHGT